VSKGDFLSLPGRPPVVRDRSRLSNDERRIEWISDEEIEVGLLQITKDSLGASREQVAGAVWRLMGFARMQPCECKLALVQ
jgi:hypothetical protein